MSFDQPFGMIPTLRNCDLVCELNETDTKLELDLSEEDQSHSINGRDEQSCERRMAFV